MRSFVVVLGAMLIGSSAVAQGGRESPLVHNFGPRDFTIAFTGFEYGQPDRWSMSSRFMHQYGSGSGHARLSSYAVVTASPGLAGGRLAAGWLGVHRLGADTPRGRGGVTLFTEARATLLRRWGKPIGADANTNCLGGELRVAFPPGLNLTVGRYAPIRGGRSFWGLHFGLIT